MEDLTEENPYSMTEEELANRINKPNTGRLWPQLYAVTTGAVCFGITLGSAAPTMRRHAERERNKGEYIIKDIDLASINYLGMMFGAAVLTVLALNRGPKKVLLFTTPLQFLIWLLMTFVISRSGQMAFLFFAGFLSVGYISCGQLLLKAYVPPHRHFFYFTIFKSSPGFGIFLAYTFISEYSELVNATLVATEFFLLFFCPESPAFLYDKQPRKAEEALKFLRGPTNMQQDIRQIRNDSEIRNFEVSFKYMLFTKVVYKAIFINFVLILIKVFTGYNIFIAFSLCLFDSKGHIKSVSDYFGNFADSIIMGCTYFLSKAVCTTLHFRYNFGIKKPLIISLALVSACLFLLSINFLLTELKIAFFIKYNWSKIIILIFHTISYEIGISIIPEFVLFDYLPCQVYNLVRIGMDCVQWLCIYIIIRFLTFCQKHLTNAGTTCLAGFGVFCGCFYCWKFVVESKGKSLLQIQLELGGNPIGSRSTYSARHQNLNRFK